VNREQGRQTIPGNVFVTGANGFIGRALVERYRALGAGVAGIDLHEDRARGVVSGDLSRPGKWQAALEGAELVIHTAALVSNTATMSAAWPVNVKATAGLLRLCADLGARRFIHLSSVAAYGFDFTDTACESDPLRPMGNSYVDTKIAAEHAVLACHAGGAVECTIIRPTDVYGPGSRPWVILPLEMMKVNRFLLPAHGRGIFSPVYIDDLVDGIVLAGSRPEASGQIFNIGDGSTPTCEEFFGYHARMLGARDVRCVGTGTARLLAQSAGYVARFLGHQTELGRGTMDMLSRKAGYSIQKARDMLGYEPRVNLEEGMRRTREWAVTHGIVPDAVARTQ
jgi:nucleoside-diphosphate-sugar epimerase